MPDTNDDQRRKNARLSLKLLAGFLAIQCIVQALFDEPYPAIKMPGFGNKGATQHEIVVRHPVPRFEFADGTQMVIKREDLFPSLSKEMSLVAFGNLATPEKIRTDVFSRAKYWFIEHVTPGYHRAHRHRADHLPILQQQLRDVAAKLYADAPVNRLVVHWTKSNLDSIAFREVSSTTESKYEILLR